MPAQKALRDDPAPTEQPASLPTFFLKLLLAGYYPFLALTILACIAILIALAALAEAEPGLRRLLAVPIIVIGLTLMHTLWSLRVLFFEFKDHKDELELRVPRDQAPALYDRVEDIADERELPMPDQIRVSADSIAHVYERINGKQVLVPGAMAVRALPQPVLAGVVAHELGHLGAGDTTLLRRALRRNIIMLMLEHAFYMEFGGSRLAPTMGAGFIVNIVIFIAIWLNPVVGSVRLYHLLYRIASAAHSRQCEFAADREELKQAGALAAARALILVTIAETMSWTRLSSLASSWVQTNESPQLLFEEQARAARSIDRLQWESAVCKALRQSTGTFDSHPALNERLAAMNISPKKASALSPDMSGPASHLLFGRSWANLEKQLADRLLAPYREAHLAKMEVRQIVTGARR